MAKNEKLITIVEAAADAFGIFGVPCRKSLELVFDQLTEILADENALEITVMESVWQAARNLQKCMLNKTELDKDMLGVIYEQLVSAATPVLASALVAGDEANPIEPEATAYVIPSDDFELVEDFIAESKEHLDAAEGAMLTLEENLNDSETLNLIFRAFHTIKGMAGFMNLEQIGLLTHDAESLLDMARKGEIQLCDENAEAIFLSIDMLNLMVASLQVAIENGGILPAHAGVPELIAFLKKCTGSESDSATSVAEERSEIEDAKDAKDATDVITLSPSVVPDSSVVSPSKVASIEPSPVAQKKTGVVAEEKIKVSTDRLDSLVNMVGELVIAQLMVAESLRGSKLVDHNMLRNSTHQGKIIRELQELSMSMRMVPIGGIFQKMARMTRDLSKRAGKEIELVVEGEHTELDRSIIDKLADPLVHMIRNSVDHGVEDSETRMAAGKRASGKIRLRAYHAGGNIVIEIQDDGKGLDKKRLLEKAISRGIISPEKQLTDAEIFNFIFLPGLSTAAQITSISGRGVGMDVVKRNIEELRGRIDIASTPGEGTTFTINLPLTLAIIDGQVVRVGKEKYIIPINSIRRSFRPEVEQLSTIQGRQEMVLVRGNLLPLVRLHALFDIEPDYRAPSDGLVMLVEEDNEACCLLVDDLLDQQQVVIKNLGEVMSNVEGVSGGAIMGDGMVRLILDIPGIIKLFRK